MECFQTLLLISMLSLERIPDTTLCIITTITIRVNREFNTCLGWLQMLLLNQLIQSFLLIDALQIIIICFYYFLL